MTQNNTYIKSKILDELETKKATELADAWMNELGLHILAVMSHIDDSKPLYGHSFYQNTILHDILKRAQLDIETHFIVDKKEGLLMVPLVGPV